MRKTLLLSVAVGTIAGWSAGCSGDDDDGGSPPPVSIAVTPDGSVLNVSETQQLVATGTFEDATTDDISDSSSWTSSNESIATVSENGLVTAVAVGSATITAEKGGIEGGTEVNVFPTADFVETEANDDLATADAIGAADTFGGDCDADSDSFDFFAVTVSAGTIDVSVQWVEVGEDNDIDLILYDSLDADAASDFDSPPGDTPAEVSAVFTSGQTLSIAVECYASEGPIEYLGTVTRP